MVKDMTGKTCVVSGAAGGIGFDVCRMFAEQGADLVMLDVKTDPLAEAAEKIKEEYKNRVLFERTDLASVDDIRNAIKKSEREIGCMHVLANCAGVSLYGDMLEYTEKNWDISMDVNLKGTFFLSQAVAQSMVDHNVRGGKIISVSSQAGRVGEAGGHAYGASKAGICMLTQTMALDLARYGICCTCVSPGITDTPLFRGYLKNGAAMAGMMPEEFERSRAEEIPLGRFAKTNEIADLICFLASDKANYITGANINITGGNVNI